MKGWNLPTNAYCWDIDWKVYYTRKYCPDRMMIVNNALERMYTEEVVAWIKGVFQTFAWEYLEMSWMPSVETEKSRSRFKTGTSHIRDGKCCGLNLHFRWNIIQCKLKSDIRDCDAAEWQAVTHSLCWQQYVPVKICKSSPYVPRYGTPLHRLR